MVFFSSSTVEGLDPNLFGCVMSDVASDEEALMYCPVSRPQTRPVAAIYCHIRIPRMAKCATTFSIFSFVSYFIRKQGGCNSPYDVNLFRKFTFIPHIYLPHAYSYCGDAGYLQISHFCELHTCIC